MLVYTDINKSILKLKEQIQYKSVPQATQIVHFTITISRNGMIILLILFVIKTNRR